MGTASPWSYWCPIAWAGALYSFHPCPLDSLSPPLLLKLNQRILLKGGISVFAFMRYNMTKLTFVWDPVQLENRIQCLNGGLREWQERLTCMDSSYLPRAATVWHSFSNKSPSATCWLLMWGFPFSRALQFSSRCIMFSSRWIRCHHPHLFFFAAAKTDQKNTAIPR